MTKKVYLNDAGEPVSLGSAVAEIVALEFRFDDETSEQFRLSDCDEDTKTRLAWHGASQKHGDSYAGAADAADPVEFARQAVRDVAAQLYAGEWRATSVGGPRVTDLAAAMARVSGKTVEECTAKLGEMTDTQKKAARKMPKIAAALAAIALEKAAKKAERLAEKAGDEEDSDLEALLA